MCPGMQQEYKIGIRGLIVKHIVSVSRIRETILEAKIKFSSQKFKFSFSK